MTVVVTGASGHVGGNLVRALVAAGREVRVLVREDTRALEGVAVERVRGDVRDPDSLRAAFEGAQVVFHLAALISIVGDQGGLVTQTNVEGPRNVARACLDCGVPRLVHTSSIHAFNLRSREGQIDEAGPRSSGSRFNPYDRSKAAGEVEIRKAIDQGLDAVIVNPTGVIGPLDYKLSRMGEVFLQLSQRKLPSLIDGGFNWVDVRDVVAGLLAAETKGRRGESYILGGRWASVGELANIAESVTGVRVPRMTSPMWLAQVGAPFMEAWAKLTKTTPLYTAEALEALRANPRVSIAKAERELGYAPRPLEDSVRDIYTWFAEQGRLGPLAHANFAPAK
ncbi:SDR family oxidoreductase [Pseudenhygromyxa sp. WMMC2535]|uniref:SDR family oxidoreductase n=1 Tax=Pseudenhygromyxa sp. WMMC2535 TaxID=2712867 RepID=UPI001596229E|nr:SDR family oxidoreductase [Pseudenhygromyxa sp. WMMC2535]NVB37108.1 SDR family oxidoreductase [Pseudenhygromyxa sp. WMMC2535]